MRSKPVGNRESRLAAALADSHDIAKKQAEAVPGDLVTLTTAI
jgi:hypothetical protein